MIQREDRLEPSVWLWPLSTFLSMSLLMHIDSYWYSIIHIDQCSHIITLPLGIQLLHSSTILGRLSHHTLTWHRVLFLEKKKKVSLCNTGIELLVVKGYTDTCVQKLFTIFMLIKLNKKIMYIYLLNPLLHTALPSEKTRLSHLLLS